MRDIRLRGIDPLTGDFIIGTGITDFLNVYPEVKGLKTWLWSGYAWHEVKKETVGEYTGLKDKNGKEIYEGDILHSEYLDYEVRFIQNEYYSKIAKFSGENNSDLGFENAGKLEIIGNIWENPDLIENKAI